MYRPLPGHWSNPRASSSFKVRWARCWAPRTDPTRTGLEDETRFAYHGAKTGMGSCFSTGTASSLLGEGVGGAAAASFFRGEWAGNRRMMAVMSSRTSHENQTSHVRRCQAKRVAFSPRVRAACVVFLIAPDRTPSICWRSASRQPRGPPVKRTRSRAWWICRSQPACVGMGAAWIGVACQGEARRGEARLHARQAIARAPVERLEIQRVRHSRGE